MKPLKKWKLTILICTENYSTITSKFFFCRNYLIQINSLMVFELLPQRQKLFKVGYTNKKI